MSTPTLPNINKEQSLVFMHLVERIWDYMKAWQDDAGEYPFRFFTDDKVFFQRKVQIPNSRFPVIMLFVRKVDVEAGGFPNTVLWNITVEVYFYTVSYDEDDAPLHNYWAENLERCINLNRRLNPIPPDTKELCVQIAKFTRVEFEWAHGEDFVVDETKCEIEVQIKLAGVKI